MDAYVATLLGGEAWDLCWELGWAKNSIRLSTQVPRECFLHKIIKIHNITQHLVLVSVGPLEYDSWVLIKLCRQTRMLIELPTSDLVIFRGSTSPSNVISNLIEYKPCFNGSFKLKIGTFTHGMPSLHLHYVYTTWNISGDIIALMGAPSFPKNPLSLD
jgi:hypothetical protein